ncbi:MAG: hypothetical protein GW858_10670 [Sphingomonadales bacterium]|nr:hypothetical protein [Sphingomonadales bacterium]
MLVWLSEDGEVLVHLGSCSWVNDPGQVQPPDIVRRPGLKNADFAGQSFDLEQVSRLLDRAELVVVHRATFDIQWFYQLVPERVD